MLYVKNNILQQHVWLGDHIYIYQVDSD